MDRQLIYPGQILPDTTLLQMSKDAMLGLAKLSSALFGGNTLINGFATAPSNPASLQVVVAPGEIYSWQNLDNNAFGSLGADSAHSVMKQGLALDAVSLTLTAPTAYGQSVNYLIQIGFQEQDVNAAVLPYFNIANPQQPLSGQGNNNLPQYTARKDLALVQAKAGIAAASGSQSTPAPDAGFVGAYVVTLNYGQSQITAANIAPFAGAPLLPCGLLQAIQTEGLSFGLDSGSANAYAVNLSPALTARAEGQVLRFKAKNANTGPATLNDGLGAAQLVGGAHAALQGGEIIANGDCWAQWNSSIGSTGGYILLFCTGGAEQVAPATQSQQAMQLGQFTSEPLSFRNLLVNGAMRVAQQYGNASQTPASGTFVLDQWQFGATQAGKINFQQVAGPTSMGFDAYAQFTVASAVTLVASDNINLTQDIESQNLTALAWGTSNAKPVSLQFVVNASVAGLYSVCLRNPMGTRSYPVAFNIPVAGADTLIQIPNIPGDTTGSWILTGTGGGLQVIFGLGQGSATVATPGAWSNGNIVGASGTTQIAQMAGATFKVTGVQLEVGPFCTAFERPTPEAELARCQRYLPCLAASNATSTLPSVLYTLTNTVNMACIFKVQTRIPVTGAVISSPSHFTFTQSAAVSPAVAGFSFAGVDAALITFTGGGLNSSTGMSSYTYFNSVSGKIVFTGAQL
ncbi:hypothetical protein [Paludibacterium purpuratum]|uniref:Uncharacterized protein n=1 Tax=Paludibacterium purpuratum TaxID=1144873 RepID=A0A4R7B6B9_9NEIS|nr:hypothetical protein [Paludibacterium purpuratum]TDR79993.1 hypothetical protein DFP86_106133 [Paludibacterium purpuratum]